MKKIFLLLVAVFMTANASAIYIVNSHYCGTVTFKDGHEETYKEVEMPSRWEKEISVKTGEGKKDRMKLDANDIRSITYWSDKFPEVKSTIYCLSVVPDDRKNKGAVPEWGVPYMGSEWGIVFRCYEGYTLNQKGELMFLVTLDESLSALGKPGLQVWQPLLLVRSDSETAVYVGSVRSYTARKTKETVNEYVWPDGKPKKGAENFKENAEIYQQILDGTLKADDLQYILDQMK